MQPMFKKGKLYEVGILRIFFRNLDAECYYGGASSMRLGKFNVHADLKMNRKNLC